MPIVLPAFIAEIVARVDQVATGVEPAEVFDAIQTARRALPAGALSPDEDLGYRAEHFAFFVYGCRPESRSEWGTHFGPSLGPWPLERLPGGCIPYWQSRLDTVRHPVLRARYADLIWDLSKPLAGEKADVSFARAAIDGYVAAAELWAGGERLVTPAVQWLERGLALAAGIGDTARTAAVKEAMFNLAARLFEPGKIGTWCFLFDDLFENKKVDLNDDERKQVVDRMEEVLRICAGGATRDVWAAEAAAERLARYYRKLGHEAEVRRVIGIWGRAFEGMAAHADALVANGWLQKVYEVYRDNGMADDARRAQLAAKEKGRLVEGSLVTVATPIEIPAERMEKYLDAMTEGPLEEALDRIAARFIPSAEEARDVLKWMGENTPLQALISVAQVDDGQIVALGGSVDEDPDGRLRMQLAESITIERMFLAKVIDRLREKAAIKAGDLTRHLSRSPLFDAERIALVDEGIAAYLGGDHLKAIHVLVPQIETCLRNLLRLLGQPTNKPGRQKGTMQEKNLGDILSDQTFAQVTPEDVRLYLWAFLADARGHNIRNRVSHGLMSADGFTRAISDRLIHVLLVLSRFVEKTPNDAATLGPVATGG